MAESKQNSQERVWQIVHQIPKGKVATYGQFASLAGIPRHSRLIARILSGFPATPDCHGIASSIHREESPIQRRPGSNQDWRKRVYPD
jgi:alkylated DNA nucleotide flippase Atl1